jgi:hypothetical protein
MIHEPTNDIKIISDPTAVFVLSSGEETRMAFLEGGGGVGKTFIYKALYYYAQWKKLLGHNSAFSGIAANLLPNGRTLHNLAGLPVPVYRDSNSSIEQGSKAARELAQSNYILIDEAPMVPCNALDCVNRKMKELKGFPIEPEQDAPFGDHAVILGEINRAPFHI